MLGSSGAEDRWRAAHSVRCLAKFSRWDVIDALVERFHVTSAYPYQAREQKFYFWNARLWLLIALERISLDYPREVAKYKALLSTACFAGGANHVLLRHFSARTIGSLVAAGAISLSADEEAALKNINRSAFSPARVQKYYGGTLNQSRPAEFPKPAVDFRLDYDFEKHDVERLARIFQCSGWEVRDKIGEFALAQDPKVRSMHDTGGNGEASHFRRRGPEHNFAVYGGYLGWHGLYAVAADLLARYPVAVDRYDDGDPWLDWLANRTLTRSDGLWLADGVDVRPLDTMVTLFEHGEKNLEITGDPEKLRNLVGAGDPITEKLVVAGSWHLPDGLLVNVMSALVSPEGAASAIRKLTKKDPFHAWLPSFDYDEEDHDPEPDEPFHPWIVSADRQLNLDADDPLGASVSVRRYKPAASIREAFRVQAEDPFERRWIDSHGNVAFISEAWREKPDDGEASSGGERLQCASLMLKEVLQEAGRDLVLLVSVRRYEKGFGGESGKFSHSTAVMHVRKDLSLEYHTGAINKTT